MGVRNSVVSVCVYARRAVQCGHCKNLKEVAMLPARAGRRNSNANLKWGCARLAWRSARTPLLRNKVTEKRRMRDESRNAARVESWETL